MKKMNETATNVAPHTTSLTENNKVWTRRGVVPVYALTIYDDVYTATGWSRIHNINREYYKGEATVLHSTRNHTPHEYIVAPKGGVLHTDDTTDIKPEGNIQHLWSTCRMVRADEIESTCRYVEGTNIEISSDFARLVGFFVADGHTQSRSTGQIFLTQHMFREGMVDNIISACGYKCKKWSYGRGAIRYAVSMPKELVRWFKALGNSAQKHVPMEIIRGGILAKLAFLDGYMQGDSAMAHGVVRLSSVSRRLTEEVMCLYAECFDELPTLHVVSSDKKNPLWILHYAAKNHYKSAPIDYTGYVYTIDTEYEGIVTLQNNIVAIAE